LVLCSDTDIFVFALLYGNFPISEFVNESVADIARSEGSLTNAILPHNLTAHIAAQTVRDSRLNSVWVELLSQVGREVYLHDATSYVAIDMEQASFAAVAEQASVGRDEIVIGYISKDGTSTINPSGPNRFAPRIWSSADKLIVLADE
jgi:hypothetical protein